MDIVRDPVFHRRTSNEHDRSQVEANHKTGIGRYMMMKKTGLIAIVLSLALIPAACVQPVSYSAKDELFLRQHADMKPWHKIAVLPFSGDPAFRSVSSEWLVFLISKHDLFEIIGPAAAGTELGEQGVRLGDTEIQIEAACEAGKLLEVDGVIVGSVRPRKERSAMLYGIMVVGASIVDISTGKVVATSVQSRIQSTSGTKNLATASTEQVVADLLPVLYALAGRTWSPPLKKQDPKPWGVQ